LWFKLLKTFSKVSIPVIAYLIYRKENKSPERKDYNNQVSHDIYNLSTSLVSNISGSILKRQSDKLFKESEKNNFGLINYFKISNNYKKIIALILIDFYMYNWHKINHTNKFLWYFHKFHHKDQSMSASSGIRFHFGEIILSEIFRTAILLPMGINKSQIEFYEKILLPIIIFHHSNIKIDDSLDEFLNVLISSTGFHRLHHSKNKLESDSNYGSVLSVWDRLFKTFNKNKASNFIDFGI